MIHTRTACCVGVSVHRKHLQANCSVHTCTMILRAKRQKDREKERERRDCKCTRKREYEGEGGREGECERVCERESARACVHRREGERDSV